MLSDWEFWLRLFVFVSLVIGSYRSYRHGVRTGQWTARSFGLILAAGLGYAAVGVGGLLLALDAAGEEHADPIVWAFLAYLVVGIAAVVWIAIKIGRKYGPKSQGRPTAP